MWQTKWIFKSTGVWLFNGSTINLKYCQSTFACSTLLARWTDLPEESFLWIVQLEIWRWPSQIDLKYGVRLPLINPHVCSLSFSTPRSFTCTKAHAQTCIHTHRHKLMGRFSLLHHCSCIVCTTDKGQNVLEQSLTCRRLNMLCNASRHDMQIHEFGFYWQ